MLSFADQNAANLALSSGRAQLGFADSPVAAYQVKQSSGQFKLVGAAYATGPYGLAMPKNSGLDKAVLAALKVLMKDGTYTSILTQWGVAGGRDSAEPGQDQRRDQLTGDRSWSELRLRGEYLRAH